jgi:hypothetical protein
MMKVRCKRQKKEKRNEREGVNDQNTIKIRYKREEKQMKVKEGTNEQN